MQSLKARYPPISFSLRLQAPSLFLLSALYSYYCDGRISRKRQNHCFYLFKNLRIIFNRQYETCIYVYVCTLHATLTHPLICTPLLPFTTTFCIFFSLKHSLCTCMIHVIYLRDDLFSIHLSQRLHNID